MLTLKTKQLETPMQTEQTRTMILPEADTNDTLGYPMNQLISVVDDWKSLNRTVLTLVGAGINPNVIEVLYGNEGVRRLGVGRTNRQIGSRISRWMLAFGPGRDILADYNQELQLGHALVLVRQPKPEQRSIIEQTLIANGGHTTRYFGRFTAHVLKP